MRFRTPLLWLFAAAIIGMINGIEWVGLVRAPLDIRSHDTYYVFRHAHYGLSLAGSFLTFAIVYGLMAWLRLGYSERLSWAQLGLMFTGAAGVLAPTLALNVLPLPERGVDPVAAFAFWNRIATIGYLLTLGSLILFVIVVADALRRRHRPAGRAIES